MPCFLLSNVIVIIFSLIDQCAIHSQILPKVNLWRAINGSVPFNFGWVRLDSPYSHPAWFISVLFLMYTIYYYILRIKNKYPFTYVPLCIIMVFGGWSLLELNWKIPFLYNWTARGYLCFFLGVLLSILFKQKFNKRLISKISVVLLTLLFVLIHRHGAESVLGNVRYSFIFIIFPLLLLAITELIVLQKMLSLPPIVYLGRISMSIYLLHVPVFKTIKWLSCMLGGGIINFAVPSVYVVVLIITIMVSTYEYEICEKRLFQRYLPNIISLLKKEG